MNHDEAFDVLSELLDVEIRDTEDKRDRHTPYNWLTREYDKRISLLRAVRCRLRESLLINHGHFSMTTSKEEGSFTTVITAAVARLKQEVRVCEQERIMAHRNDHYLEDVAKDLRDRFKQTLFDPPVPEEPTT